MFLIVDEVGADDASIFCFFGSAKRKNIEEIYEISIVESAQRLAAVCT